MKDSGTEVGSRFNDFRAMDEIYFQKHSLICPEYVCGF
jgi:hypothetical protein